MPAHESVNPDQFPYYGDTGYTRGKVELNRVARRLAPQGTSKQLWNMADWHATKGRYNEEHEYRAAAKLREQTEYKSPAKIREQKAQEEEED